MNTAPFIPSCFDDAELDPYAFRVLCHIYRRGELYGSTKNAAKTCQMDRKRLYKALATLIEKGLISRESRKGQTSVYIPLLVPKKEQVESLPVPKREQVESLPVPKKEQAPVPQKEHPPVPKKEHKGNPLKVIQEKGIKPKIVFPFSSDQFKETWQEWISHRKQLKNPLTDASIKLQLKKLQPLGEETAILWIQTAIERNWKSFFPPPEVKTQTNGVRPIHEVKPFRPIHEVKPFRGYE
jgi:DNA-binding MarR family transcriptional regulator